MLTTYHVQFYGGKDNNMDKNNKDEIIEFAEASSSLLGLVHPALNAIPLVVYVFKRISGLVSKEDVQKRISKIEDSLTKKEITMEEFREKITELDEHGRYFTSNSLQSIFLNCLPETVDVYISILIDYVMNKQHNVEEELCGIIRELNGEDIKVLKTIKDYYLADGKKDVNEKIKEKKQKDEKIRKENEEIEEYNKKGKIRKLRHSFSDRNIIIADSTVFWDGFRKFCDLPDVSLNYMSLFIGYDENNEKTYEGALFAKALIKLDDLGIIQMEYISTLGTINNLNIDRFHITIIGKRLLDYIDQSKKGKLV